jgi:hypothetical protein
MEYPAELVVDQGNFHWMSWQWDLPAVQPDAQGRVRRTVWRGLKRIATRPVVLATGWFVYRDLSDEYWVLSDGLLLKVYAQEGGSPSYELLTPAHFVATRSGIEAMRQLQARRLLDALAQALVRKSAVWWIGEKWSAVDNRGDRSARDRVHGR